MTTESNHDRPDAVRAALSVAGPGDAAARLSKLRDEFADVLGVERLYVRHQGAEHFITGDPMDTLNFPGAALRSGEPRYRWEDRGGGVQYGYARREA